MAFRVMLVLVTMLLAACSGVGGSARKLRDGVDSPKANEASIVTPKRPLPKNRTELHCPEPDSGEARDAQKYHLIETDYQGRVLAFGNDARIHIAKNAVMSGDVIVCGSNPVLILEGELRGTALVQGYAPTFIVTESAVMSPSPSVTLNGGRSKTTRCYRERQQRDFETPCPKF